MGVSLTDLINDKRTVPVEFAGRTVTITYHPNALNRNFYKEQADQFADRRKAGTVMTDDEWAIFWFRKIVCGWDITKGDKEAPIDEATLTQLGTRFLLNAIETVSADLLPNPKKSEPSPSGSPPAD